MPIKGIRKILPWLWRMWQGNRTQALLNVSIGIIGVVADLAFVWATKLAIDIATHIEHRCPLKVAFILLIGIMTLELALAVAGRWIRAVLGVKAENRMQQNFFDSLLHCRWAELRAFHTAALVNRLEQDVPTVVRLLTETLPTFFTTCVQFVGAFVFLFFMDRRLAVIVLLLLPFFALCSKLYVKKMRTMSHDIRNEESRAQSIMQESLQHALVIKTLGRMALMGKRLAGVQHSRYAKVLRRTRYSATSALIMNAGFAAGYLVTFVWGVTGLQEGAITYGALLAFIQLVGQIQGPVRALSKFIPVFIGAFTAAERLMELETIPREYKENTSPLAQATRGIGLRFEGVNFAYTRLAEATVDGVGQVDSHKKGRPILRNFSHTFAPGSVTAIVGETGAGKTTLVRLLLALLQPEEGHIYLYTDSGQRETHPVSPATRSCFAYVPQGNTLLSGTIRENLLMGNPRADDAAMRRVLHLAAADFVLERPLGLDSPCGEMGDGLSEGQAQRVSIARALLHESPILLLDEATSALDTATERQVIANIVAAYPERTILFVTHRPEAMAHCSEVLRMSRA